ncbi:pyruvate kinase [Desulfobulbus alkaliphilus]|uniref:pyruvate kinase n=1 Tax=Desulfobulbus alkaliphilus TaxID=869814 RepID=UPI001964645F|nr:pyruvate kinase [Desulfobulbus alkaliphilus]MBM9536554.1 hypothetical protein [Desulfobulbus alkaliphilus]
MSEQQPITDHVPSNQDVEVLLAELSAIRTEMINEAERCRPLLDAVHPNYRESARNLLHYLVLRRRDLRLLQRRLSTLGLSSLGRAESCVLATVDAVLDTLDRLVDTPLSSRLKQKGTIQFVQGAELLARHTDSLLGPATPGRGVRIMVTMPTEAAYDYSLVHNLLQRGMDCMRINCVRDDADIWLRMIEHLRRAEQALGRSCRVMMDLGGPKLRTGQLEPGPAVLRIRLRKDAYGRVITPARLWLHADAAASLPPSPADGILPVPAAWLARLRHGTQVQCIDVRGRRRQMSIVDVTAQGCWAEMKRTAYIVPGTCLRYRQQNRDEGWHEAVVGDLPRTERPITLQRGDLLTVTAATVLGRPASYDSAGFILTPAMIGCTVPGIFADLRAGESIWFDDGKIGGVIEGVEEERVRVRITHARPRGEKLRSDKGINFPESKLALGALTAKDLEDLHFVAHHADLVGLSFANSTADVEQLQSHLEALTGRQPAVVLKIETRRGFENLPDMLLTAMQAPCCGVMIARGDLAVECGFERLAEVQEEILWICEAAHVPVIWATQVLESLAKEGMPSRAEITDAAMGHRAECVMLNKGPHVMTAVQLLDGILRRMQNHQTKKRAMLRALRLARLLPKG